MTAADSSSVVVRRELVTNVAGLEAIREEWAELAGKTPGATPFQTPEWVLTWWRHFGSGDLLVLLFRDAAGKLAGILPAFRHIWHEQRQITLIGSGISDYLNPLISEPFVDSISSELADYLLTNRDWDLCDWQDLSAEAFLSRLSSDTRLSIQMSPDTQCSEISIDQSFDDFLKLRSNGLRRNLRRYRQKAEQTAPVEIEITSEYREEFLDALVRLHAMRWREQGESGMIAANRSASFLRDVARQFAACGMLQLIAVRYQRQIAAVILAFPYRNTIYAYLSGFDPAYSAYGFGALALCEALRYAFAERRHAWNFLRGEESYKFDWGARAVPKSRILIRRVSSDKA